jgi:peptide/nickel transport system substrate-binding protein
VLEANEQYWRKTPTVKTLVFRAVPDSSTRLAMLKRGEADVAYTFRGVLAEEARRSPGLTLKAVSASVTEWLYFAEQWDPKSPWADRRVRLAANLAIDRQALNEAETLGLSRLTASIIPRGFEYAWAAPLYEHDPARAKRLLAEAGYPNGFDAGTLFSDMLYAPVAETIANYFRPVGIRVLLQPIERAGFFKAVQEKRLKNVILIGSGALGNAATRLEAWVAPGGTYVYGSYADIDGLWREAVAAPDPKSRGVLLERIQRLVHEKAMFAPIWEFPSICAYGPRVAESGLGLIANFPFSAPYEDLRLKGK